MRWEKEQQGLCRDEDATTRAAGMGETMLKREAARAAFKGGGERQQRKDLLISNRRFIFALRKQKKKKNLGNTGKSLAFPQLIFTVFENRHKSHIQYC